MTRKGHLLLLGIAALIGLAGAACGDDGGGAAADSGDNPNPGWVPDGSGESDSVVAPDLETPGVPVDMQVATITSGGAQIHYRVYTPLACNKEAPCPAVVLVPDGLMGGDEFFGDLAEELASKTGIIVVRYNPPARGIGSERSDGLEDWNGPKGQDVLRDVLNALNKKASTGERLGVVSFGYGLSAASGALGRFQATTLAEVDFLIDVEGPVNRCFISQAPYDPANGIDGDGPGVTNPNCNFDLAKREQVFPTQDASVPPALLCHSKAFPIAESGQDCSQTLWWNDREPSKHLKNMRGAYLRLQMRYDHRQPSLWHALEAIHFAIQSSKIKVHQLNDVKPNKPLLAVGEADCLGAGCFLDIPGVGNAIQMPLCKELQCTPQDNPYKVGVSDYSPMTLATFMRKVLPKYIDRMISLEL